MPITTIEQLVELYQSVYYVEDVDPIPLICAVVISCKMEGDPIWLWLVGGSSAGKTCLIDAIGAVKWVREVSMLTPNTFLSGAVGHKGEETSLLMQMGKSGIITFRDWTTMLSTSPERLAELLGQMRQIFDGKITKATGTGKKLEWVGKACVIAGTTEAVHIDKNKTNEMGTRQLMYTLKEQNRKKTTRRAMDNARKIKSLRAKIQDGFTEYINYMVDKIQSSSSYEIPEDIRDEIADVADLVSIATTGVARNYRGEMELMMSPGMPMRYAEQASNLGAVFMMMNNGTMPDYGRRIIFKTLLDSIPKQRLMCLRILAQYDWATTKAIGLALGYSSDLVGKWLADLDALNICKRVGVEAGANKWQLKEEYRAIMVKYDGVKYVGGTYTGVDTAIAQDEGSEKEERESAQAKIFGDF